MASIGTLRDTIDVVRRLWQGETIDGEVGSWRFAGGHLRSPVPEPPVYVSASQPKALELTGEVADGLILLAGLFPEGLAFAREHVARGRARSTRPTFDETLFLYGAIADDEAEAIESARSIAAWFPKTAPGYARLAGMSDELVESVNAAYAGGEFQHAGDAARLIPTRSCRRSRSAARRTRRSRSSTGCGRAASTRSASFRSGRIAGAPSRASRSWRSRGCDRGRRPHRSARVPGGVRRRLGPSTHTRYQGDGRGTLPIERFRFYVEQNLMYLLEYARAMAIAASKAGDGATMKLFADDIANILDSEIPENRELLRRILDLGAEDRGGSEGMAPANVAYTSFLVSTAVQGGPVEVMAAIVPCTWSYGDIGSALLTEGLVHDHPVYAEWIRFFGEPSYEAIVAKMRADFEAMAAGADDATIARLFGLFRTSVRLERGFWDMAYGLEHWPEVSARRSPG